MRIVDATVAVRCNYDVAAAVVSISAIGAKRRMWFIARAYSPDEFATTHSRRSRDSTNLSRSSNSETTEA